MEECENGFITGYQLYEGNPADDALVLSMRSHLHSADTSVGGQDRKPNKLRKTGAMDF